MKTTAILKPTAAILAMFVIMLFAFSACSSDDDSDPSPDPINYSDDAFPPGYVWAASDYPSLTAPISINTNIGIGPPILTVTKIYKGDFNVTATAVKADWSARIVRDPSWCGSEEHSWDYYNEWSYLLPNCQATYYNGTCTNKDLNYNIGWGQTVEKYFKFVDHGIWQYLFVTPSYNINNNGEEFLVYKQFELIQDDWPELYLSMERDWIKGPEDIRSEGKADVTISKVTGVEQSTTSAFTNTLGLTAGVELEGISASINQTFTTSGSETNTFYTIDTKTETLYYNIPANELWRYITLYGVERFKFTQLNGEDWSSTSLVANPFGNVENKVKTFLMIVKYNATNKKAISSELIEIGDGILEY